MSVIPLIIITFILTALLGLSVASLEKNQVMQNWNNMRCSLPVMSTASYFKPASDPRTNSQFAADNFQFCMKNIVETVVDIVMAPLVDVFTSHASTGSLANTILSDIRTLVQQLYTAFMSYMKTYFLRFEQVAYQMSKIVQHLRLAMRRVNAIATSLIYVGLSVITGIMNTIDLFMVVIMIILAIMVILIILLWFVLFPVMPIIMSVISALLIVATGATVGALGSMSHSFCFRGDAKIVVKNPVDGTTSLKPISEIKLGDVVADGGIITAIIETINDTESLFDLNGIAVAGSHVVQQVDGSWDMVENDPRAHKIQEKQTGHIYCLNTTTHTIPIMSTSAGPMVFKDWEEFPTEDKYSQFLWNYYVLKMLNSHSHTVSASASWFNTATPDSDMPLVCNTSLVFTEDGAIPIHTVKIGDKIRDSESTLTSVIGVVKGTLAHVELKKTWHSSVFAEDCGVWKKWKSSLSQGNGTIEGTTLITESGSFIVLSDKLAKIRDFTDVGYKNIDKLYPLILERLRKTEVKQCMNDESVPLTTEKHIHTE